MNLSGMFVIKALAQINKNNGGLIMMEQTRGVD